MAELKINVGYFSSSGLTKSSMRNPLPSSKNIEVIFPFESDCNSMAKIDKTTLAAKLKTATTTPRILLG